MRKAGFLIIMALLALPASALAQADEYSKTSLKDMTPKWQAAYNAGDAAGLAALYAKDGVLHPPNSAPVDGREAIEAFWAAVLESGGEHGTDCEGRGTRWARVLPRSGCGSAPARMVHTRATATTR